MSECGAESAVDQDGYTPAKRDPIMTQTHMLYIIHIQLYIYIYILVCSSEKKLSSVTYLTHFNHTTTHITHIAR